VEGNGSSKVACHQKYRIVIKIFVFLDGADNVPHIQRKKKKNGIIYY
jgi:hypothetical protein